MKYILILLTFISLSAKGQNLDTVSVNLTLRSQDWAWSIGKYGEGNDSLTKSKVRQIRDAIRTANPATWNTNVTINAVPGRVVYEIYKIFCEAPFGEILNFGNTTAERTVIYTNIRAINNSALQYYIGLADGRHNANFQATRNTGKNILIDQ